MSKKLVEFNSSILVGLKPVEIPDHEFIRDKFITLYNSIHRSNEGEMVHARESHFFKKLISDTPALQQCTNLSLYTVFIDIAVNGLSLETGGKPLAYVTPRSVNVGTRESAKWEKRATLVPSPYGELFLRIRSRQIRYADNPVVCYEGDTFEPYLDAEGNKRINYRAVIPRKSTRIVGSFIKITKIDGTIDYEFLTEEDVARFKTASEKNNKRGNTDGKANDLYTSNNGQIDPGFLAGKTIKHAFRAYPKVRVAGAATMTEAQIEQEFNAMAVYGLNPDSPAVQSVKQEQTAEDFENEESVNIAPEAPATAQVEANSETF
jgi:recombinational DNA repair protein RecT